MKNGKVWSPAGLINGVKNSLVGKGESLIDYDQGKAAVVDKGTVGKDTQPSIAAEGDNITIAGNDKDYSKLGLLTFAQLAKPLAEQLNALNKIEDSLNNKNYGKNSSLAKLTAEVLQREIQKAKAPLLSQLKEITDRLELLHDIENQQYNQEPMMYKKGKESSSKSTRTYDYRTYSLNIPWWQRAIPNLAGLAAAFGQYNWWSKLDLHRPDIYAQNPYEARALNTLAGLRYNPIPALSAANQAERRATYNNELAGGISNAQRYLARTALGLGAMQNAANVYDTKQLADNKYKMAFAEAALKAGDSAAARRLAANQYNDDAFARAHGRKVKGIETSILNGLAQLLNYYQNEFKYRTWNDAMRLYIEDQARRRDDLLNSRKNGVNTDTDVRLPLYNINLSIDPRLRGRFGGWRNYPYNIPSGITNTDPLSPVEGGFPRDYRWINHPWTPSGDIDWSGYGRVSGSSVATPPYVPQSSAPRSSEYEGREIIPLTPGLTTDNTDTRVTVPNDNIPHGYNAAPAEVTPRARAEAKRNRDIVIGDNRDRSRYTLYYNFFNIPYRFPYTWSGRYGVQGTDQRSFDRLVPYYYYSQDGSPIYSPNEAYPDTFIPSTRWDYMMFNNLR